MKFIPFLAALLIHSFCLAENQGEGKYRLVWADEFEKSGRPNPAIWTLGIKGEWPDNGEVDILECYKGDILANACWGTKRDYSPKWDSIKKPITSFKDPKWDEKFHIWRMDWDEKEIKLYVDDMLLNTTDLTQTLNAKNGEPKNPFLQPHYLLLNLAIGGQAAGDPKGTVFPTRYEIDYVRVYQQAKNKAR